MSFLQKYCIIKYITVPISAKSVIAFISAYKPVETEHLLYRKDKNMYAKRIENVLAKMKERQLTQLLVSEPSSVCYLTGTMIHPGERFMGLLLFTDENKEPVFFLHRLFPVVPAGVAVVSFSDADDFLSLVARETDTSKPLGIDKHLFSGFLIGLMERGAASSYVNGSPCVDMVRAVKAEDELEKMRVASQINDKTIEIAKNSLRIGMTEKELEQLILDTYRELGADDISFPPIVAFGSHTADPHHENSHRRLKESDVVLLDIGCKKDGYCSDMTRTFFTDEPSPLQREVYELVRTANENAEKYVKPDMRLCDIDEAARSVIRNGGYDKEFTHRLGHFIGMDTHEYGDVSAAYDWAVKPNMMFSIEPGIYLQGKFGVRIEDLIIVTETGCEVINKVPKELTVVSLKPSLS